MKTNKSFLVSLLTILFLVSLISVCRATILTYVASIKSTNDNNTWNVDGFGFEESGVTEWSCTYFVKNEQGQEYEVSSTPPGSGSASFVWINGKITSRFKYITDHIRTDEVGYNDVKE